MPKDTSKPHLPAKSWIVAIVAILVLSINFVVTQLGGEPLPESLTGTAEEVATTSIQELGGDSETHEPTATQVPQVTEAPTTRPTPTSDTDTTPTTAPATVEDGIWEGVDADFPLYVLALSWQPAFCETRPDKEECFTQTEGRFDATNFVLHGLWPDDGDRDFNDTVYCAVSQGLIQQDKDGDWCDMPDMGLSDAVETDLFVLMPGATSCLHDHEWIKHGTCSELTPEAYYALSNHLTALFSQSDFNAYVAERIGAEVQRNDLLDRFEAEFGPGSDQYLSLQCDDVAGTSMLTELYITLRQDIDAEHSFGELFPDRDIRPQGSCPRVFWIDEVGLGN